MGRRSDLVVAGALTAAALGAAAVVGAGGWPGEPSGCIAAGDCYCEAFTGGLIAQPVNTISNVAFLGVGMWVLRFASRRRADNALARSPLLVGLYAGIAIFLGLGSILFHGAMTEWGGWADLVAMHMFITFFLLYELMVLWQRDVAWFVRTFTWLNIGLAALLWPINNGSGKYVFATIVALTIVVNRLVARRSGPRDDRWFWAGLASYGAGNIIWALSRDGGPLCAPDSYLQGHALWHLAAAGAVALLFRYLWSEQVVEAYTKSEPAVVG